MRNDLQIIWHRRIIMMFLCIFDTLVEVLELCLEKTKQQHPKRKKTVEWMETMKCEHSGGGNDQRSNDDYVLVGFLSYAAF